MERDKYMLIWNYANYYNIFYNFLILTLINYVKSTKIKTLNIINFKFHSVKINFLNKNFYFL